MADKCLAKPSQSLLQIAILSVYLRRINYDWATVNISFFIVQRNISFQNYISLKTMRLGVLSWEKLKNRETHCRIVSLDQLGSRKRFPMFIAWTSQKSFKSSLTSASKLAIVLIYKHSKSTWIVLWLLWNVQNQHIAERERSTTVVVLISGPLVWSRLIYERCVTHLHTAVPTVNLFLTLRVIHNLTRPWSSRNQRTLFIKLFRRFWCYHVPSIAPVRYN